MRLGFRIKHHFFSAFRELFVHHHGSLEFRAKIFALVIAADEHATVDNYILVKDIALRIYHEDEERAELLMLSTKELVHRIREHNNLDIDSLIQSITKELKFIPRYAKKIDTQSLKGFLAYSYDDDTTAYQENIIEFLENLKCEILH